MSLVPPWAENRFTARRRRRQNIGNEDGNVLARRSPDAFAPLVNAGPAFYRSQAL
jgi:hypothetical protein